jgi:uncharacterized protein
VTVETEFTPLASAAGGALIGASAVLLMVFNGRVAGISGIVRRLIVPEANSASVQALAFLIGLIGAPLVWTAATGASISQTVTANLPLAAAAGLLVGFGAVLGGGCTSGHGVCGLSLLSWRSLVATAVFMTSAVLIVFIVRHIAGGSL